MKNRTTRTRIARQPRRPTPEAECRLPHERDEAAEPGARSSKEIAIAEKDLREGRVDTDNYTRMREVGEAGLRKRR